jgi:L-ascorbate metabolism protein UlaG (beta-lactamase superfamily)
MCSFPGVFFRLRAVRFGVAATAAIATGRLAAEPTEAPVAAAASPAIAATIDITYVANEGFLISGAGRKVLIDGIFTEGFGRFETPTAEVLRQECNALPPFDHLDALLITHYHPDHINPADVVRHLANDPQAVLIGPPQVGDLLKAVDGSAAVARQIRIVLPRPGETIESSGRDLRVKSMALQHLGDGERKHQNLGFLFNVAGFKLLHVGDAGVTAAAVFREARMAEENIDIALLNCFWFDDENAGAAQEIIGYLKPKAIVLMHQGAGQVAHYRDQVAKLSGLPPVFLAEPSMPTLRIRRAGSNLVIDRPSGTVP